MQVLAKHATAIVVGAATLVIGGALLALVTGLLGTSGSDHVVLSKESPAPPENFRQAVAQRSIWQSAPLLVPQKKSEELLAPVQAQEIDLKVTPIREIVEGPERFERNPVVIVGEVVEQEDVPGRFIEHEYRLVEAERTYDAYVAGTRPYGYGTKTGKLAWAVGRLIGVGTTRDSNGGTHRSIYVDSRAFEWGVEQIESFHEIGSRAIFEAVLKMKPSKRQIRP